MQNKLTVTIAGQEYNLIAGEDACYMKKVAAHVDEKVSEVKGAAGISQADAAVLAALNIADEYFKEQESAENLRAQLKEYLEEATDLKLQLAEAKRQIFALNQGRK